jgi:hypothetical protein
MICANYERQKKSANKAKSNKVTKKKKGKITGPNGHDGNDVTKGKGWKIEKVFAALLCHTSIS